MDNISVHKNAYSSGIKERIGRSNLKENKFYQILIDLIAQI